MVQPGTEIQVKNYEIKALAYRDALKIITHLGRREITTILCINSIFRRRVMVASMFGTALSPKIKEIQPSFKTGENLILPSSIYHILKTGNSRIDVGNISQIWLLSMEQKKSK